MRSPKRVLLVGDDFATWSDLIGDVVFSRPRTVHGIEITEYSIFLTFIPGCERGTTVFLKTDDGEKAEAAYKDILAAMKALEAT